MKVNMLATHKAVTSNSREVTSITKRRYYRECKTIGLATSLRIMQITWSSKSLPIPIMA